MITLKQFLKSFVETVYGESLNTQQKAHLENAFANGMWAMKRRFDAECRKGDPDQMFERYKRIEAELEDLIKETDSQLAAVGSMEGIQQNKNQN